MQQEQDSNFITRLHAGKLDIIPWPVIDSRDFYKLFATLKKRLDLQKTSHPSAGGFLHTIKTLMAKLKVRSVSLLVNSKVNDVYLQTNDWGALSSPSLRLYREFYSHSQQILWPSIAPNYSRPSCRLLWPRGMPRLNQILNP